MLKKTFKSELIRNSSLLISGNVIGQGIAFLAYIILARLYSHADFGVFALFSSVASILTIIGTGKYEEAIMLTKSQKETYFLMGFIIKVLLTFSIFLFIVLLLFRNSIFIVLKMESLHSCWYLLPVMTFFSGIFFLLTDVAIKRRKFKTVSFSSISFNGSSSVFKIMMGYLSFIHIGMILSSVAAQILACFSFYKIRKDIKIALRGKWKYEKLIGLKYANFPKYNMPRNLVSSFSWNLPFLLLTGIFGEAVLGIFSLAFTLGFRPFILVSASLYQVFYEKMATKINNKEHIFNLFKTYSLKTALILLPLFVVAYFISPWLFGFIFDEKWQQSGVYFQYLLPWIFCFIISRPMFFIPSLFSCQRKALWLEVSSLVINCIFFTIGIYLHNFILAIILYSLSGVIFSIITMFWFMLLIHNYEKTLLNKK